MDKSFKDRLLRFGSGASVVAALLGQSNIASANPMFRPMVNNAMSLITTASNRRDQSIAPLILEPTQSSHVMFVGHKSHSSHRSHSSHHSSHAGSSFSGSASTGSSGNSSPSGSAGMGLLDNQKPTSEPKAKPASRPAPPPKPSGYKELDLPPRVFVASIERHVNGRVIAVLRDEKADTTLEVSMFDEFRGWTITEIDESSGIVLLENLTGEGPNLPSHKLKKKKSQ